MNSRKVRIIAWSISVLLLVVFILLFFLSAPIISNFFSGHYPKGELIAGAAFFAQDLVIMLSIVLIIAAISAHAGASKNPVQALRVYITTLLVVLIIDSFIWWTSVAPRHINPISNPPGADFGAGLIAFEIAALNLGLILVIELIFKINRAITKRSRA